MPRKLWLATTVASCLPNIFLTCAFDFCPFSYYSYIFAPFLLGLVTDFAVDTPGIECAAAGIATFLGLLAIILL
jgi:hypothetical protein